MKERVVSTWKGICFLIDYKPWARLDANKLRDNEKGLAHLNEIIWEKELEV